MSVNGFKVNNVVEKYNYASLDNLPDLDNLVYYINTLEHGSITDGANSEWHSTVRARHRNIQRTLTDIYISSDTGRCLVFFYTEDGTYVNNSGWQYNVIIPARSCYRCIFMTDDNTSNPQTISDIMSAFDISLHGRHDIIDAGSYEHGSMTNGVNDTYRQAARARSKTICEHDYDVEISTDVGQYIVSYYDEEDTFKFATAWKTKVPYIIPAGMRYRLLLTLDSTSTASIDVPDILAEFTITEKNDRFSKEIQLLQPLKYHFNTNPSTIGTWSVQNNSNLLTIAHISDVHSDWIRYKNFYNFFKSNPSLIDAAIQTGDLIDAPTDKQIIVMHGIDPNNDVIWCTGNHEMAGVENNVTYTSTLSNLYSKFGLSTNTGKLYHYVDFTSKGIRLIVLNDYNTDNTSHDQDYGATQLDWFVNTLKDAASNDLAVIVAMHVPESSIDSNDKGFYTRFDQWSTLIQLNIYTAVEDIIDAFVNGTTVTTTYYNNQTYSADFTGFNGDFVCYLTGHRHQDSNGYSHNHASQLYLNITCGALRNWLNPPTAIQYTAPSDLPRIEGTDCENAFNVYTFDLKNRIVKVLRIGANMNDLMEPRVSAYYSF